MVSKKLLGVVMSIMLAFGSSGSYFHSINPAASNQNHDELALESYGTVDLAIANDEKLIESLKKQGKISKNATPEQSEKVLKEYLRSMENDYDKNPQKLRSKEIEGLKAYAKDAIGQGIMKKETPIKGNSQTSALNAVGGDGTITKDKALLLLIEFPDFPHNQLTSDETDMYYKDYNTQHYEDMLFNSEGYKGPKDENLISFKQFYDQQSGGSYDIEGQALGWYKASQPAKYYGADNGSNHNVKVRDLVKEALIEASKNMDLSQFDIKDPYDLDGDGNINEPDGIIDHLMIIHSGAGQEAGGGRLGNDAIWSHSSKVYSVQNGAAVPWKIPNTNMSAFPYTIMPEDGAAGVFAHEFGHDLGLPDEYDTNYTGLGEPIEYWSIMSSGSWAGKIPGTEPTGFSPYAKEYFQNRYKGNWQHLATIDYKDITTKGTTFNLNQASIKAQGNDAVKVTLPQKTTVVNTPTSGTHEYFSGKGDNYSSNMTVNLDLTNAVSPKLTFKTWYDIEQDFDYASIKVKVDGEQNYVGIPGNITTTTDPYEQNPGNGITGSSQGKWVDAQFDLSSFAGKKISLMFSYWTDAGYTAPGFYVDDINVISGENTIFSDNAETTAKLTLDGFKIDDGKMYTNQYYLLEWRNHTAADLGLAHIARGKSLMSYDPGLLVWYADELYTDNWTGPVENGGHPGDGYLGLVDADQSVNKWSDGVLASTRYQVHDAAFSARKTQNMFLDYGTRTLTDNNTFVHPFFDDSRTYMTEQIPDAGRKVPKLGLKVYVTNETKDRSAGTIVIKK